MNILLMIGEFTTGGAESVVINLTNHLDKRIFNVAVHARTDGPLSTDLNPEVKKIIIRKSKVTDMSYLKELIQVIKENKVDTINAHLFENNFYGFLAAKSAQWMFFF